MSLEVNAHIQQIPPSIKKDMDTFGKTDPAEMNIDSIRHSAESIHSPREGCFSGLDADEIAILGELSPELKEQYELMANSDINKKNLQYDIDIASFRLESAKNDYDEKNKNANNWFLNIFRSQETKEQLQKEADDALKRLEYAQLTYDGESNNVISYETILQRNSGMEFDN